MGLSIGICDDEQVEREYIQSLVQRWADEKEILIGMNTYTSGENFLFHYEDKKKLDILLLDIQMGELDGVQIARRIRADNEEMQIIFITGFPDFMAEGYDVSALHYLMKPVGEDKLFHVLSKAYKKLGTKEKALFLTIDREQRRLKLKDIMYVESQGHYVLIKTCNQEYRIKMKLSEIAQQLDKGFFRCQRSFIVSLKYIVKISRKSVLIENAIELPLSRGLYGTLNQALIDYFN